MKSITGKGSVFYRKSRKLWVGQYYENENGHLTKKYLYGKTKEEALGQNSPN